MKIFNKLNHKAISRKTLTLELTDAEYRSLIRAVDIGNSVYGIMGDMVDDKYKTIGDAVDNVQSKLLRYAHEFGMQHEVSEFEGEPTLKDDVTSIFMEDLLEFEDMAMWEGLANNLAKRDLSRQYSEEEWNRIDDYARIHELCTAESRWAKEFEDFGLERVTVEEEKKK